MNQVEEGTNAFLQGNANDTNPYLEGSDNYVDWDTGWWMAYDESTK